VQSWSPFAEPFAGLTHYEGCFDEVFWKSLWNTVVFMSSSRSPSSGPRLALLVDARIRGRGVYRAIFISYR
jgi:ABC-type sugar transport system permease subunit